MLTLGVAEGPPAAQLFSSIVGVIERSDGVIVIADIVANELRAFSGSGEHLWTAGGFGGGPGEFADRIRRLSRFPADSVLAAEDGRVTIYTPDGQVGRTIPLRPLPDGRGPARVLGALADGTTVASSAEPFGAGEVGDLRQRLHILYLGDSPSETRELGILLGSPGRRSIMRIRGPSGDMVDAWAYEAAPMGPDWQVAIGTRTSALAQQDRFEFRLHDGDGRLDTVIRVLTPSVSSDFDRFVAAGGPPQQRARRQDQVERSVVPDTLPRFGDILLDSEDRLWVQEYVPPYEDRVPVWWIFRSSGELLAQATFPPRFQPYVIARDHVVGVWLDGLDVPYVQVLPLADR